MKVTLNQNQLNQIQEILQQFPIKYLSEVQKIVQILNESVEQPVEKEQ
jgi:hypothetical protein